MIILVGASDAMNHVHMNTTEALSWTFRPTDPTQSTDVDSERQDRTSHKSLCVSKTRCAKQSTSIVDFPGDGD